MLNPDDRNRGAIHDGLSPRRNRRMGYMLVAVALVAAAWGWYRWSPREMKRVNGFLRVAVCQYDSRPEAYRWNADHALRYAREAAEQGAGVIILPEYSFCTAADTLSGEAFREMRRVMRWLGPRLGRFCRRHRCYLFVNLPHEPRGSTPKKPLRYNRTLVYAPDGSVAATYDKHIGALLDKCCLMREGPERPPVDMEFGKVGLMICKDAAYPQKFAEYGKADLIVVQFGHITDWTDDETDDPPWLVNDMGTAHGDFPFLARRLANAFKCNAVFANKTGLEPDGAYTGGSCIVDAEGQIVVRADFGGDVLYADFALDEENRLIPDAPPIPHHPGKAP